MFVSETPDVNSWQQIGTVFTWSFSPSLFYILTFSWFYLFVEWFVNNFYYFLIFLFQILLQSSQKVLLSRELEDGTRGRVRSLGKEAELKRKAHKYVFIHMSVQTHVIYIYICKHLRRTRKSGAETRLIYASICLGYAAHACLARSPSSQAEYCLCITHVFLFTRGVFLYACFLSSLGESIQSS